MFLWWRMSSAAFDPGRRQSDTPRSLRHPSRRRGRCLPGSNARPGQAAPCGCPGPCRGDWGHPNLPRRRRRCGGSLSVARERHEGAAEGSFPKIRHVRPGPLRSGFGLGSVWWVSVGGRKNRTSSAAFDSGRRAVQISARRWSFGARMWARLRFLTLASEMELMPLPRAPVQLRIPPAMACLWAGGRRSPWNRRSSSPWGRRIRHPPPHDIGAAH